MGPGWTAASGDVALQAAPLLFGGRAPHAVPLAVLEGPREALFADRAREAERERRSRLLLGDGEEDVRVDAEAGGAVLPEIGGSGVRREGLEINVGEPVDPHLVAPPLPRPREAGADS